MSVPIFKNISNRRDSDRFIPRRSLSNLDFAHFNLMSTNDTTKLDPNTDIFNQTPIWKTQLLYTNLLKSTIKFTDSRILSISDITTCKNDIWTSEKSGWQWPVRHPRKNPLIEGPIVTLDLPNFSSSIDANIMDWSSTDRIATIFDGSVFLWHNSSNAVEKIHNLKLHAERALRWNYAGTELAIAGVDCFSVWSLTTQSIIFKLECTCTELCTITTIAWDNTDRLIATGCTRGAITKWYKNSYFAKSIQAHNDAIISIKICISNRFLCSSGFDCSIRIWRWPSLEEYFELLTVSPIRAIEFHPWQECLLAVGAGLNDGSLSVWNLNNYTRKTCMKPKVESFVDSLAWNPLTGELVSSHQIIDKEKQTNETKILVLSSMNTVVDTISSECGGRVLNMMWNPTGTQIATAESEEVLNIWNFLGNNPEKNYLNIQNKYSNKQNKSCLKSFYKCIR